MRTWMPMLTVLAAVALPVFAEPPSALAPVTGLVNEDTILVAHVRVDDKTFQAVRDRFKAITEAAEKLTPGPSASRTPASGPVEQMTSWYDSFVKAGGTEIYFLVNPGVGEMMVLPLSPKADVKALLKVMNAQDDSEALPEPSDPREKMMRQYRTVGRKVGDNLVVGAARAVANLKDFKPAPREDLAKAMAAAGDAPLSLSLAMSVRLRKEMPTSMPSDLGGQSTEPFSAGFRWLSASARIAPALSIDLVVQATDEKAAQSMLDAYNKSIEAFKGTAQKRGQEGMPMMAGLVLTAVETIPLKVKGSQVVAHLDLEQIDKLQQLAGKSMAESRRLAMRAVATAIIQQLLRSCIEYADSNNGEFPADFEAMKMDGKVFANPRVPGRPGFVCVRPAGKMSELKDPSATVLIYENYKTWDPEGIAVGFADGHVAVIKSEEKLKELLKAQAKKPGK